jgi:ankyrin repeat protein
VKPGPAIAGGFRRVREALEAGAKVSIPIHEGTLPLYCAITLGRCEAVQVLLDYGADVERSEHYNSRPGTFSSASSVGPALFAAINCNQPTDTKIQMLSILLDHGADIRCQLGQENLMDLAARYGDGAIGDLLRSNGLLYGPREMAAFNRLEELQSAMEDSPDLLHEPFKPLYLVGQRKKAAGR